MTSFRCLVTKVSFGILTSFFTEIFIECAILRYFCFVLPFVFSNSRFSVIYRTAGSEQQFAFFYYDFKVYLLLNLLC